MGRPSHFSSLQRRAEEVTDEKLDLQADELDLKSKQFQHQKNLNLTALDRMQDVWKQQDLDWKRNRNWAAEERSRRYTREDAAFDHQQEMWGLQERMGKQNSMFRQWYQNSFKNIWDPIGSTFSSMTSNNDQKSSRSLFGSNNSSRRTDRSLMGGRYGY